jgi:hypothetical protein
MMVAKPICRKLLMQAACLPFAWAFAKAGSSSAARIAMIAMTTSNSINVNALKAGPTPGPRCTAAREKVIARWEDSRGVPAAGA